MSSSWDGWVAGSGSGAAALDSDSNTLDLVLLLAVFATGLSITALRLGATGGAAAGNRCAGKSRDRVILGTHGEERNRVIALFIVAFFVVFFWAAFEQAGSSMSLFADKFTDLQYGSFAMPSTWFQSVNSGFIILLAPVFATPSEQRRIRLIQPERNA